MTPELALPLEASRVRLRRFAPRDAEPFAAYRALPEVARYQTWPRPYTRAMADELALRMASASAAAPGPWFQVAVAMRSDDSLIGDIGIRRDAADPTRAELGFTLSPGAQGQGFMREALDLLFAALARAGIATLTATVDTRNAPSIALLRRLDFVAQGEREAEYFGEPCVDRDYSRSL